MADSKRILERLQRRGVVELENIEDDNLAKLGTHNSMLLFEKNKAKLEQALEIIDAVAPAKEGLIESFVGAKKAMEPDDFGEKVNKLDMVIKRGQRVLQLYKESNDKKTENMRLSLMCENLKYWLSLDIPLDFEGTKDTKCFIGTLPYKAEIAEISAKLPDSAQAEIISQLKTQTNICVVVLREQEKECCEALREMEFSAPNEVYSEIPARQKEIFENNISENLKTIEKCTALIEKLAKYRDDYKFMIDYLGMRRDKYEAFSRMAFTDHTMIISGYIPQKYVASLTRELEHKYEVAISITEPGENEDTPVLLENGRFSAPVESITEMYALPNKNDLDPTPIMSFFYYLFFGMMLSDAGYGLLMVIGTGIALKKFALEEKMRQTLRMFRNCGISTIIWGALFGSWFGDIVPVVAREFFGKEIGSIALWFEPIADPMKLLLFSFALGICHLFLGLGANLVNLWRQGKRWDAVCEVIPVYITVLGVAPIGASILTSVPPMLTKIGGYMAIAGVVLILLTSGRGSKGIFGRLFGGLYGLYNMATGYLSDILSYSRLLALGLATGSIAGVINLIGTMPSNLIIKAIMLTLVFVVGHLANLAINLLGAYVHTDRLQFVELFSKFYEGGGRAFEPLTVKTKYVKFKEEIKYE